MFALVILISIVTFFAMGRLIGRADVQRHVMREFEMMLKRMKPEEREQFENLLKTYYNKP